MTKHRHLYAVMACLMAAALWGLLWYPLRLLDASGMSGLWATLIIYVSALAVVFPLSIQHVWPKNTPWLSIVLLALASGWTNLAFILAMIDGTVVRVLLLFYLSPVWTIVLAWCFYREPINRHSALHLSLAFTGAMLLLWTEQINLQISTADFMALSAGFAFAANNLLVRKLGQMAIVHKMVVAWIGVILLAVVALWISSAVLPKVSMETMLAAIALGMFGMVLMTYAAQYGVTHIPLHQSATLFLIEVPVGALSAAWLVAEVMSTREWIGGACVMLAAWLSIHSTINHSKKPA